MPALPRCVTRPRSTVSGSAPPRLADQRWRRNSSAVLRSSGPLISIVGRNDRVTVTPIVAERWRTGFDWRALEARLGEFPQFTTVVEGQTIHFLWVRSGVPGALPLLATHGWPGSFLEFADLAGPLSGHDEAFDLVVPSIPGFGFSPLSGPGWSGERVARAWTVLMARLGYERYGVHGGDLGAGISRRVARLAPRSVVGSPPRRSDAPSTAPRATPAPATTIEYTLDQCFRPGVAPANFGSTAIRGARPNSPMHTTNVWSSNPRWSRSAMSAEKL